MNHDKTMPFPNFWRSKLRHGVLSSQYPADSNFQHKKQSLRQRKCMREINNLEWLKFTRCAFCVLCVWGEKERVRLWPVLQQIERNTGVYKNKINKTKQQYMKRGFYYVC